MADIMAVTKDEMPASGTDRCDWEGCEERCEFEAWFGTGVVRKLRVCKEHLKQSRGWLAGNREIVDGDDDD